MGRTISGKEILAGQHEFKYNRNQRLLQLLAQGKRLPKEGKEVITEKESLISKTTYKSRILSLSEKFEAEFKKVSGQFANTSKIFSKVIGRKKTQEEVASV
ncbi:MAG: hypothetical protein IJ415_02425 [Clostridia bacterium]|nr:hypothetical protein [Clostridia bacterium]